MQNQDIYARALRCPREGYAASSKFRPSPHLCPRCGGALFTRTPVDRRHVIGIACQDCSWLSTFLQHEPSPPTPPQPDLFPVEKVTAPEKIGR